MKIFKIVSVLVIVGLGAFFYTNPYMLKPILKEVSKVQGSVLNYFDSSKEKNSASEVAEVNTYNIDPKIANKADYYVDSRIKSMYREISDTMIDRDKEIRKRLLYVQDKSIDEVNARMAELEPFYVKEREKVIDYCKLGSKNCLVDVSLTGSSVEGSDVKMNLRYNLDAESLAFFNEVHYVDQVTDKWYEAKLVSVNEKRYYPQLGKFQDREQNFAMQDDTTHRIDISHILEGNSNQWNVKF